MLGVLKAVGDTCKVLHHLLQVNEESKAAGFFTRLVGEGRCKPELVLNIIYSYLKMEISERGTEKFTPSFKSNSRIILRSKVFDRLYKLKKNQDGGQENTLHS